MSLIISKIEDGKPNSQSFSVSNNQRKAVFIAYTAISVQVAKYLLNSNSYGNQKKGQMIQSLAKLC
jgi:hypothetical protein